MFDELIRQAKRKRGKERLARESKRLARTKTGQARIRPQFVQIIEDYRYVRQDGTWRPDPASPTGVGTISIPTSIDDNTSFDKPGRLDVRSLQLIGADRRPILGSFLNVHNHSRTDLSRLIDAGTSGFDSIELEAPAGVGRPDWRPAELGLTRSHHRATYHITPPVRLPIETIVSIVEGKPQHPELAHGLYFLVDCTLHLPDIASQSQPRLEAIEFGWPWLAEVGESVRAWSIKRPDPLTRRGFAIANFLAPLRTSYDTTRRTLTCAPPRELDALFHRVDRRNGTERAFTYSVLVEPTRPLQLIDRPSLDTTVIASVDSLLSGTEVGLHHATGYVDGSTPIETTSLLRAGIDVDLAGAMALRLVEQRNNLRFRGVQPSVDVIDTIAATIQSCGYRLEPGGGEASDFDRTLIGVRLVNGTRVHLDVTVRGHHRKVRRTLRHSGGPRLREDLDAGDIDVELLGFTEGDRGHLTTEMNTVHASLRHQLSALVEA